MSRPGKVKLLGYGVLTIILFLAGDRILALAFQQMLRQSDQRFAQVYRGDMTPQILVMGNSRGVNGFYAPELAERLDRPVYNLSYNGMSPVVMKVLFEDYLTRNAHPELLVLEVTNMRDDHGLVNELRMYMGASMGLAELTRDRYPASYWASMLSHLYRFNGEMFLRTLYYLRKSDQTWINRYSINPEVVSELEVNDRPIEIRPDNLAALKEILSICAEHNIPVRLVVSPYLPQAIQLSSSYSAWLERLQQLIGDEYPILDYSDSITGFDSFADPMHMNYNGSMQFMDLMVEDGVFQTKQ